MADTWLLTCHYLLASSLPFRSTDQGKLGRRPLFLTESTLDLNVEASRALRFGKFLAFLHLLGLLISAVWSVATAGLRVVDKVSGADRGGVADDSLEGW